MIKNATLRHGVIGNFENALRNAKGEYIFLADQDDVWFPNKYKTMLSFLSDYDLVHCKLMGRVMMLQAVLFFSLKQIAKGCKNER